MMIRVGDSIFPRYLIAIAAVAIAISLRLALDPLLGDSTPFALLLFAVLMVAVSVGRGPALLAVVVGAFASAYFLLHPRGNFAVVGFQNQFGLFIYGLVGSGSAWLGGALREARRRAETLAIESDRRWRQLRITLDSIGDGILVTDREGRVSSLNSMAEKLSGSSSAEIIGQTIPSILGTIAKGRGAAIGNAEVEAMSEKIRLGLGLSPILIGDDNRWGSIEVIASPIRDASGEALGSVMVLRDLTERQRSERDVRRAGEQARTILERTSDAYCAFDRDWRFVYINPKAEVVLGREKEGLLGKNHWEEFPATLGTAIEQNYRRAMAGKEVVRFEEFYPPHDRWYEINSYPSDEGLSVFFRDVTHRRHAEDERSRLMAAADQQRRTYETALSNSPDFNYIFDLEGRFQFVNASLLDLWRRPLDEVIGKTFFELDYPEDLARRLDGQIRQVVQSRRPYRDETPYSSHLGVRQYEYILVPVVGSDGAVEAIVGSTRDITDRKVAEEQLREQRELLRVTLASVGDGVVTTDVDGRITYLNAMAEVLTGWTNDESRGRVLSEVFQVVPEEIALPLMDPVPWILGESASEALPNIAMLIARDGSRRAIEKSSAPIQDEDGHVSGVVVIFRDVSERRAKEQILRQNEERLRLFVEHSPAAIAMLDRELRYLLVSRRWLLDFDLGDVELQGEHHDRVMPELAERWKQSHLRCLAGATERVEEDHYVRADGRDEWLRWEARPWKDDRGEIGGIIIFSEIITELIRNRKVLQEHVETLSGILAATVDNIYVIDRTGHYQFVSTGGARVMGFEPSEVVGKHWRELGIPQEVMDVFFEQFDEVIRTEQPTKHQTQFSSKTGQSLEYEYTISPIAGGLTFADTVVVVSRDITKDKIADREKLDLLKTLETRSAFIDAVLRQVPAAIVVSDAATGQIMLTNEEAHRIVQHEYEPGRTLEDYGDTYIREALRPDGSRYCPGEWPLSRAQAGETIVGEEIELVRSDQSRITIRVNAGPIRVGDELVAAVVAYHDISEIKADERSARFLADVSAILASPSDERETLRTLANLAVPTFADWAVVDLVDSDGSIKRLAVAHSDPSKEHLAFEVHRRFPPDLASSHGPANVVRTSKAEFVHEFTEDRLVAGASNEDHIRLLRELGLTSYLCVPLIVRGEILGALGFALARPGRRYDEHDLAIAQDLASRAAIAIENARLYEELKQADRMKNQFLATLAHELRNPLAPIRNALYLMKESAGEGHVNEADRAMAERQVVHITRLIDDLMDVARISRGKIELQREIVNLATIINQAVETSRHQLEERRHRLTTSIPSEAILLEADPTRLEQILWNLLNNAAKYSEPGGHIHLSVELEESYVTIRLKDSGIGIKAEMLPRIFDMFTQVEDHRNHAAGGLGIGLSLVRALVEMHEGTIHARSDGPGLGSEFSIKLPTRRKMAADENRQAGSPGVHQGKQASRRILIVDDNEDAAKTLSRLLTRLHGQETRVAHTGPDALVLAEVFRPEVILLDIGLPLMDGYEVARAMRRFTWCKSVMIVALTGWGQDDDRRRSTEAGIDHHLVKPIDPETLVSLLDEVGTSTWKSSS